MKIKLCIIFGGQSSEHKDSVDSFENVYTFLQKSPSTLFELTHIIFAKPEGGAVINSVDLDLNYDEYKTGEPIDLIDAFSFVKRENVFLFSTLFSQNGEDGKLQGLASLMNIKTNLGEPLQPSLCISKHHLNQYVKGLRSDLLVPKTQRVEEIQNLDEIWETFLGKEMVVKPNSLGSSLHTDKFHFTMDNYHVIKEEIRKILEEDKFALIQDYVVGEEISCAVLKIDGEVTTLPVGQVVTERGFFGYPEKSDIALNSKRILPEDHQIANKVKEISKDLFKDLDLNTVARFDYICTEKNIYFLECNAFPSLHRYSFLMQMLNKEKKNIGWLIENIVKNCLHKKEQIQILN